MKHYLLTCLILGLICCQYSASAQETIEWGQAQKSPSKNYSPNIIGEDSLHIYVKGTLRKDNIIESYVKGSFSKKYSEVITPEKINRQITKLESVQFDGSQFFVLVSQYDKKSKVNSIYGYRVDAVTGEKKGKEVKLFETEVEKKRRRGAFVVITSPDKTKVLVSHIAYHLTLGKHKHVTKLLDADLNIIFELEEEFAGDLYEAKNGLLDNNGSFYFQKKHEEVLSIVSYDADRDFEKWEEFITGDNLDISMGAGVTDFRFNLNANGDLTVSGYYHEPKKDPNKDNKKKKKKTKKPTYTLAGCFYAVISGESKEIITKKVSRFDDAFIKQFQTQRQERKGKDAAVPNAFHDIYILNKSDGGIVLVGEMYYHTLIYTNNGSSEYILYGDLIALNFSSTGDLLWANRIPKKQIYSWYTRTHWLYYGSAGISLFVPPKTRTVEYFGYLPKIQEDKLVILFNDNPKNNVSKDDQTKMKPLKKLNKATVTMFTIDMESGEKKEELFLGGKDFKIQLKPMIHFQENESSPMYTFGMKGKTYKFGVMKTK
ncbi:MAG: hypothetical protein ACI9FU_001899 [Granulosicoccus sp.]|jgi:hypothetical protein